MENSLENYYQEKLNQLKKTYKKDREVSFFERFESLISNLTINLIMSKVNAEEKIHEGSKMSPQMSQRLSEIVKNIHNNFVESSRRDIQSFIEICKPEGVACEAPDFKEFEIK